MLNSFINDDGKSSKDIIEQGIKELEETLKKIKEDEKIELEESKMLYKSINDKVKEQILKHFNMSSLDKILD